MSGGSYEYLCFKDAPELIAYEGQLEAMRDRLIGLGYAKDAARETDEVLLLIRQASALIQMRLDRLHDVWRAVEWWDSSDSSEATLIAALAEYRGALEGAIA